MKKLEEDKKTEKTEEIGEDFDIKEIYTPLSVAKRRFGGGGMILY